MEDHEILEGLTEEASAEAPEVVSGQTEAAEAGKGAEEDSGKAGIAAQPPKKQSKSENSAMAAARRAGRAEAMEEITQRLRNARIPDPSREGQYIDSVEAYESYGQTLRTQRLAQKAKDTGRTVEDLAREEAVKEAGEKALAKQAQERQTQEFLRRDMAAFQAEYPEVDIGTLENNAAFRRFCGSRLYKEPLAGLYADYLAVVGEAEESGRSRREAKTERSTGSGSGGSGRALTASEQKALDEWNAAYPGMKMTAKEFLER